MSDWLLLLRWQVCRCVQSPALLIILSQPAIHTLIHQRTLFAGLTCALLYQLHDHVHCKNVGSRASLATRLPRPSAVGTHRAIDIISLSALLADSYYGEAAKKWRATHLAEWARGVASSAVMTGQVAFLFGTRLASVTLGL